MQWKSTIIEAHIKGLQTQSVSSCLLIAKLWTCLIHFNEIPIKGNLIILTVLPLCQLLYVDYSVEKASVCVQQKEHHESKIMLPSGKPLVYSNTLLAHSLICNANASGLLTYLEVIYLLFCTLIKIDEPYFSYIVFLPIILWSHLHIMRLELC